ncbi:MAG TPA: PKD domain-containing protein [Thermoplasmata archaeon]|nr:PKD domain-containing protein [Thermoplasmata archaeon]
MCRDLLDVLAQKGDRISLAVSAFDGDGDALAVSWSLVSGPASVTLNNGTTMRPDFVAHAVGVYLFRLEATDTEGAVGSDQIAVTVWGLAPTAAITANPTVAGVGASISFDGTGSSDPDGTIVDYAFDFGDGTPPVSGPSPAQTHVFSTPGSYTVSLTVTDDDGNTSAPATVQVSITLHLPRSGPRCGRRTPGGWSPRSAGSPPSSGSGSMTTLYFMQMPVIAGDLVDNPGHSNRHPPVLKSMRFGDLSPSGSEGRR